MKGDDMNSSRIWRGVMIAALGTGIAVAIAVGAYQAGAAHALAPGSQADAVTVEADAVRVKEVLANLLANALSHTPAGGSVRLALSSAADIVSVSVADTGSGMSADDVARMFDRFYKGRNSRGAGLGLAIARNLVGAHGGHVMATSVLGKGTYDG